MAGNTPQPRVANAAMNACARHQPTVGAMTGCRVPSCRQSRWQPAGPERAEAAKSVEKFYTLDF
jgi:hypothetical protein